MFLLVLFDVKILTLGGVKVMTDKVQKGLEKLPATDLRRIKAHLPTEKEDYLRAQEISEIADKTKRFGAGDITGSGVTIMPSGSKAYKDFHDKFTETGKFKLPEKQTFDPQNFKGRTRVVEQPRGKLIRLPLTFCPDCGERDKKPGEGSLSIFPITSPYDAMGLVPGDVFRYQICRLCTEEASRERGSRLTVAYKGDMVPMAVMLANERHKRRAINLDQYVRTAWTNRLPGIFFDEQGRDYVEGQG